MNYKRRKLTYSLHSKFARSIFIPLISIFSFLILSIIVIVFTSFVSELRSNVKENKENQLELIERNISNRLREISSISYNISTDNYFFLNPIDDTKYSGYAMSESLKKFLIGNDFITYLAYYRLSEQEKIYTSVGEMSYSNFWRGYIEYEGYTEEDFLQFLQSNSGSLVLPMERAKDGKSYLTVVKTIPLLAKIPRAYVLSFISDTELNTVIESIFTDCFGEVFIFDEYDNLVYEYGNVTLKLNGSNLLFETLMDKSGKSIKINGESYLVKQCKSEYNSWKYVCVIRENDIMSNVNSRQYSFLTFLFILLIISVISTIVCMLVKYAPINQLARTVMGDEQAQNQRSIIIDEHNLLSSAFDRLIAEKKAMYREIFYSNLLEDQYDERNLEYSLNEYDIHFEYSSYCAIAINLSSITMTKEERSEMSTLLEEFFEIKDVHCDIFYRSKPEYVLALLNVDDKKISANMLMDSLLSLCDILEEKVGVDLAIGIGEKYDTPLQLSNSVKEAMSAMFYSIFYNKDSVLRYKDIETENVSDNVFGYITNLLLAVKRGNEEQIHNIMQEMRLSLVNLGVSQIHKNYIAFNIVTSLHDYTENPQLSSQLDEIMEELLMKSFVKFDVLERVEKLCIEITKQRKNARNDQKDELMGVIKQTISDHLFDSMLSLEGIASYCGISSSYLSRFFKANMGCTPMNYIEILRMNTVKERLSNSEDSLKQILEETGYIDQSNFIRKFKRLEGVTPMNYRKMHKDE